MAIWRMAFRDYAEGPSFWPECRRRDIAALTYCPVAAFDFTGRHLPDAPGWAGLEASEKGCLRYFVFDMQPGDVIYVKEGDTIVGRGVVVGPYQFDNSSPIVVEGGKCAYHHHRRVRWGNDFVPVKVRVGQPQITTLLQLCPADVEAIETAAQRVDSATDIQRDGAIEPMLGRGARRRAMPTVSLTEFRAAVKRLDGHVLETDAREQPFTVRVQDSGLEFIPGSGAPRPDTWANIERVLERHASTESLRPVDYQDVTFNASYILRVLRAVLAGSASSGVGQ
jgi:hypothetical protein